jgi:hypothetical protein
MQAIRTLLRAPAFSLVVIISIALGFAANATVFSTASVLYGTSGTDLLTFATVSVVLLAAATVAILVPALRAAHVQPTNALRYE